MHCLFEDSVSSYEMAVLKVAYKLQAECQLKSAKQTGAKPTHR